MCHANNIKFQSTLSIKPGDFDIHNLYFLMQVRELSNTLKNIKLKNLWDCNDIAKDTAFQNKISKALQNLVN